jgi:hypothetical protein
MTTVGKKRNRAMPRCPPGAYQRQPIPLVGRWSGSTDGGGIGEKEAEAITNAIKEASASADLATKRDVQLIVSAAKADMVKWDAGMLVAQPAVIAALVKLL